MADQKININIGSSYNGSGMTRAMGAVDNLSRTAKSTARAVGGLAGAFEGLGGTAAKSIGAVAGGLGALATGGIFGAIIFGVTTIISLFQKWKAENNGIEKTKQVLDGIKTSTDKLTSGLNASISNIDKYTQSVNKLTTAHLRLADAQAKTKKAALETQIENMPEGGSGEDIASQLKQKGEAGLSIARIDADAAKEQADAKVAGAESKIKAVSDKLALLDDTMSKLKQNLMAYDEELEKAKSLLYIRQERGAGQGEIDDAKERIKAAEKARNEFVAKTYNPTMQQRNDVLGELNTANVEKKASEQERLNVIADNERKLAKAERAYQQTLGMANAALSEQAERDLQETAETEALATNQQMLADKEEKLQKATSELEAAEKNYAKRLNEAQVAAKAYRDYANGGVYNPNGATAGRKRSGASANNVDNSNGGLFAKAQGWDQRYWQSHWKEAIENGIAPGLSGAKQRDYKNIAQKIARRGEESLTKDERRRKAIYDKLNPELQFAEANKAAEKAKEQRDNIREKINDLKTSIDTINKTIERLTAK